MTRLKVIKIELNKEQINFLCIALIIAASCFAIGYVVGHTATFTKWSNYNDDMVDWVNLHCNCDSNYGDLQLGRRYYPINIELQDE